MDCDRFVNSLTTFPIPKGHGRRSHSDSGTPSPARAFRSVVGLAGRKRLACLVFDGDQLASALPDLSADARQKTVQIVEQQRSSALLGVVFTWRNSAPPPAD